MMPSPTVDVLSLSGKKLATKGGNRRYVEVDGEVRLVIDDNPYIYAYVGEATTGTKEERKPVTGYIKKSVFDALNVSTVPIPANFAGLEAEMMPPRLMYQLFRVVEVVENEDYVEVTARHVWYDNLKNYTLWKPTEDTSYTAAAVCRNILTNAISSAEYHVASDCTDTKPGSEFDYEQKNLIEAYLDPDNGVCAKFGLSLLRDNWDFYCLKDVGYNRGFIVENGKNLLGVERTESIENVATRVAPIGKDKKGEIIWLDNNGLKYVDSANIDDYSRPMVEIYDTGLQVGKNDVTDDNIQAKLLEAGQKRFSEDHIDQPEVEMTIEFLSLGDTEEYSQYRGLDKVYLYDILTIHDTVRGYDYSAQVVGVEHDILTGMLTSVTIGKLNDWDGTRKIATWQVPEVNGENIRLKSISAGSFAPGAINSDDLGENAVHWVHLDAASITELTTEQLEALTANIHELIAGTITAADITAGTITTDSLAAGAVTAEIISSGAVATEHLAADAVTAQKIASGAIITEKLAANAVTAEKIASSAVTADKINAEAINADKIDANAVSAINAKLGTANIASAVVASADINYAHIKDLDAQSAFFGQTVFEEAVGGKLYVPRLSVGYAQMIAATISDLVIQATNDKYYKLDVDMNGDVTATEITPTSQEIEDGHTEDGRTIYMGTDIVATDLNTENIYAGHALMDEITANLINVNKLWAREAFINALNVQDLSSNTYIQSVVGDWESGSTITQTIDGISSRISSLGYGTIYYTETEPSHSGLVQGDIWIRPLEDNNTWGDLNDTTWQDVLSTGTWGNVMGRYYMYTWTGTAWKLLYDSTVSANLQTEIDQNAYAITLKADQSTVDLLSQDVSDFSATLTVQAQEIEAAVSAVNTKTSCYVSAADPTLTYTVSLGDIWIKTHDDFSTWGVAKEVTWGYIKTNYQWQNSLGDSTYVWDGSAWVMTSDRASEVTQRTLIDQTRTAIDLLAETSMRFEDEFYTTYAELRLTNDRIATEVARATTAEGGKIDKTSTMQTADQIVSEAVRQSGTAMSGLFISKTTQLQTADAIVAEAVSQSATAGNAAYLAKTTSYQTAEAIVNAANSYTNGQLSSYSTTSQTASAISAYVASNAYTLKSGVEILAGQVRIYSGSQTSLLLSTSGIDMVTAGKAFIHASDGSQSSIIFGTDQASATFMVGISGDVKAKSLTVDELTVNGKGFPGVIVSESMPSGNNILWCKPSSETTKQWTKAIGSGGEAILDQSGGTLGKYRDYTVSYAAADYLAGDLFYGVRARLYVYVMPSSVAENCYFKARLKNGNNWIDIGSVTQMIYSPGTTVTLDVMMGSTAANIMSVTGGSFTLRLETNWSPIQCRLVYEDIVLKAKNNSGSGAAACSLFYIS